MVAKMSAPVAIAGMIFFGTSCSLLAKLIYSVSAVDSHGNFTRYEKPWFQVLAMFAGMSVCILLDLPKKRARRAASALAEHQPLLHEGRSLEVERASQSVWIVSIPTLFDLFATACGTTGLLYTNVSVYQMLRGAMLVWTALLSILFLRRSLTKFNYGGLVLCVVGIALVGAANICAENDPRSRSDIVYGVIIILLGQILQAAQVVMEEFLLQDLRMSSVRVVAWEGLFGIMHCVLWVFPLLYLLPGRDGGHLEDAGDAVYMLTHSWAVAAIIFTDMAMMLFYNVCGMEVTDSLSAVHRVVIETLRTLCVWIVDLLIYYVFSGGRLGEKWTPYSYLQLVGFTLLVLGTVLYNYEILLADYQKRKKGTAVLHQEPSPAVSQVGDYEAINVTDKMVVDSELSHPLDVTKPVAVDGAAEKDEDEDEDLAGSYFGSAVGSVAHSPFLVAFAGTPGSYAGSLPGSLRHRNAIPDSQP